MTRLVILVRGRGAIVVAACLTLAAVVLVPAAGGHRRDCTIANHCADEGIWGHAEPQPIHRGETSTLKITAKNNGPADTYGVDLQVDVPWQLKILSTTIYGGRQGTCGVDGTFVRCDIGDQVRDEHDVTKIRVKAKRKGTFISKARVYTQATNDINAGNNHVEITVGVIPR